MLGFLAEFLVWLIVGSIENFSTSPGRVANKKLQRLIERSRKLKEAKE